jgi:ABC-type Co2+ transport system permease subunit
MYQKCKHKCKKETIMHIEAGVVNVAKMVLSYGTAVVALGYLAKEVGGYLKEYNPLSLVVKSILTTILVFSFFEIFPHFPIGVSEVHLILGTTLFLVFGVAPAAIGLTLGLLVQGIFFAPFDLPQYGINITTLLVPLFSMSYVAKKIIPKDTPYKDLGYKEVLQLSALYQGGIVLWVAFWALYGQGFGAENLANIALFGSSYLTVIIVEPFIDLAVLAVAKNFDNITNLFVEKRLYTEGI